MAGKPVKPNGQKLVRPGDEEAFLASFKVGDLIGVGRKTREALGELNVRTVGELQKLPRKGLEAMFGALGVGGAPLRCFSPSTMSTSVRSRASVGASVRPA